MKSRLLIYLYFVILALELFLRANGFADIEVFIKPLLMPILIIYVLKSVISWHKNHYFLLAALVFSWFGDILLLEKINIFIGGLGAFLIAHICYIFCFYKGVKNTLLSKKPLKAIPFVLLGVSMLMLIKNNLGELLIPVIIYTSTIIIMGLAALNRKEEVNLLSYNSVLLGALLFIVSDSIIALTRFYTPIVLDGVWIMLFYGVAQYLIVKGILAESIK